MSLPESVPTVPSANNRGTFLTLFPIWIGLVLVAIFSVSGLAMFQLVAEKRAAVFDVGILKGEPIVFHHDQHAYLNAARHLATEPDYAMPRYRSPGLPWLLSFLYAPEDDYTPSDPKKDHRRVSEAFFTKAKHFAVILAMISLVSLFFFARLCLPLAESFLFAWACGWLLYVFKAPYVRPELAFYTLFFMTVILCLRLLRRPSWILSLITGALLAAAYLLKSVVLPLVALFLGCLLIKAVHDWLARHRGYRETAFRHAGKDLAKGLLVPLSFFLLLSPYFATTARLNNGNPFYSIHSSVFMWMDSRKEKLQWNEDGEVDEGPESPSLKRYLKTHNFVQIVDRPWVGARNTLRRIRQDYYQLHVFTTYGLGMVVALVTTLNIGRVLAALRARWIAVLFLAGCFLGFGAIYGWYEKLNMGPRGLLSLYPFLPFFGLWLLARFAPDGGFRFRSWSLGLRVLCLSYLFLHLAVATGFVIASSAWTLDGAG